MISADRRLTVCMASGKVKTLSSAIMGIVVPVRIKAISSSNWGADGCSANKISSGSSKRSMRRAIAGGQPQFASIQILMAGPAKFRIARTRSKSSSGFRPTLTLRHCTPHWRGSRDVFSHPEVDRGASPRFFPLNPIAPYLRLT